MTNKPTIHTYFDNRHNQMAYRYSNRFFECEYDPEQKQTPLEFFSGLRQTVKENPVFFCGRCKRPLKISGGNVNGKKCFHFKHLIIPPDKGECEYYDGVHLSSEEIKAMEFHGRVEGPEHKAIKYLIAKTLEQDPNTKNVAIEEVAKKIGKAWRKPDIRADYQDFTVVFEVQLSMIFHDVILERNDDYRSSNWYICWVFDKLDEKEPLLRTLDAWANNNYNILIFDEKAKQTTTDTGVLHFTVKYTTYHLVGDGEDTLVQSKWKTELVAFSSLTFDKEKMMIYRFDSEGQKKEKEVEREIIIYKAKEKRRLRELKRIEDARFDFFIHDIPEYTLSDNDYERLLMRLNELDQKDIDCLLQQVKDNLVTLDSDARYKWLVVITKIYDNRPKYNDDDEMYFDDEVEAVSLLRDLWRSVEYGFIRKDHGMIKDLALIDYIKVFNIETVDRALKILENPFDDRTFQYLDSFKGIREDDKKFIYYAPLIMLNRINITHGSIPANIMRFIVYSECEFWCLASIVRGKPVGQYRRKNNLKDVVNHICNDYPHIAKLALHLIDKYNRKDVLIPAKAKAGRNYQNQYERLQQVCEGPSKPCDLSIDDLKIMFRAPKTDQ